MHCASSQISSASESNTGMTQAAPVHDPIGLGQAIASGMIREQDVIALLTEMCRCLLVARRKESQNAAGESPLSTSNGNHPSAFDR